MMDKRAPAWLETPKHLQQLKDTWNGDRLVDSKKCDDTKVTKTVFDRRPNPVTLCVLSATQSAPNRVTLCVLSATQRPVSSVLPSVQCLQCYPVSSVHPLSDTAHATGLPGMRKVVPLLV